ADDRLDPEERLHGAGRGEDPRRQHPSRHGAGGTGRARGRRLRNIEPEVSVKHSAEAVIIGGGCMGASVAYHLARRGMTDVVLVEREKLLATGSTGRNAGGVRHQFSNEANVRLSIESIALFERFE